MVPSYTIGELCQAGNSRESWNTSVCQMLFTFDYDEIMDTFLNLEYDRGTIPSLLHVNWKTNKLGFLIHVCVVYFTMIK